MDFIHSFEKYSSIAAEQMSQDLSLCAYWPISNMKQTCFQIFLKGVLVLINHCGIPPSVKNKQMRYLN